jgi:hypothetical protein
MAQIPAAYYSAEHHCWFVPVASELFDSPDKVAAEPVRVEIRDGTMWITRLSGPTGRGQSAGVRYPGHCARCGVGYETPTRPQCECAGDPPIDHDSRDYQTWVDRVMRLRWDAPGR